MTPLIWITALASAVLLHFAGFYIAQETHWLSLDSLASPKYIKTQHTNITVELSQPVNTTPINSHTQETPAKPSENTQPLDNPTAIGQQAQNQAKMITDTKAPEIKAPEKVANSEKIPEANIPDSMTTTELPLQPLAEQFEEAEVLEELNERAEKQEELFEQTETPSQDAQITRFDSDELDEITAIDTPNTPAAPAIEATNEMNQKQLSDTFNIIGQEQSNKTLGNTAQSNTTQSNSAQGQAKNKFNGVFSPKVKRALEQAVQDQKDYLAGRISRTPYPITKDADGTRYVDIKGVCWKMPPEGESGEWFIVYSGCSGQKKSFHIELGITPEMFGTESPFIQGF